ncbi:MAG: prepilin-type N-terminal cleavage/methylation domain-containing protein [Woeseiaceae bacterium]
MPINCNQKGISLIELVIFIVILSVALTGITLIYINTTRYSADPLVRIRTVELAQSTLEEILLRAYDESTPVGGGCVKYPVQGGTLCIPPTYASQPNAFNETALTAETGETNRSLFDDVDDYNNKLYCGQNVVAANTACPLLTCQNLEDESGTDISTNYAGFAVCIKVSFAGGAGTEINNFGSGVTVLANDAKRIDVIVTDPLNSQIGLSAYRLNF